MPLKSELAPKVYFYKDPEAATSAGTPNTEPYATPKASPMQAGIGTGIGMGLVSAMVAAEQKNLHFYRDQPRDDSLQRALAIR